MHFLQLINVDESPLEPPFLPVLDQFPGSSTPAVNPPSSLSSDESPDEDGE